ncbi:MAG: hypothetical protein JWR22_415 [Herminiimonas sp.]|nr:hypothetical protein [Herminiimonas sp.]
MNVVSANARRLRESAKVWVGTVVFPTAMLRWRRFIKQHPALDQLSRGTPQFISKIHGPYLMAQIKCQDRVDLLISHYRLLFKLGYEHMMHACLHHSVLLCEFAGREKKIYRLELCRPSQHFRWGEVALRLSLDGRQVYTLAFSVTHAGDKNVLVVGGMEGLLATDDVFCVKRITRDLYGLRPRDLLINTVTEIARHLCCDRVILTGNRNKIAPESKRVCRRSSDYDRAWRELNAASRDDGNFELTCKPGPSRQYWIAHRPADKLMNTIRLESVRSLKRHRDPRIESDSDLNQPPGATGAAVAAMRPKESTKMTLVEAQ